MQAYPACAISLRFAVHREARLPSASPPWVPECVGCACIPAMMGECHPHANSLLIALITPRKVAQREAALLLHRALGTCIVMPLMIASMPPSIAMRFWFSALPHTSLRMHPHASSTMPACQVTRASTMRRGARPDEMRFVRFVEREVLQCPTTVLKAELVV